MVLIVRAQRLVYGPLERPDVEVLVDDAWWPGEVRMATELDDGTWTRDVQYRTDDGQFVATFPRRPGPPGQGRPQPGPRHF
jgi:hypothetical protein